MPSASLIYTNKAVESWTLRWGTGKTETVQCSGCSSLWLPRKIFCLIWIKNNQPQLIYWRIQSFIRCRLCIWLKEYKSLCWVQELLIFRNSKEVFNVSRRGCKEKVPDRQIDILDRLWKILSTLFWQLIPKMSAFSSLASLSVLSAFTSAVSWLWMVLSAL